MGGFGSGRPGTKRALEECRHLVITIDTVVQYIRRALRDQGYRTLPPESELTTSPFLMEWTWDDTCCARMSLQVSLAERTGYADFQYDIKGGGFAIGPQHYQVNLVATPCGFGGVRWWWVCPQTGRRVRKLYLPAGGSRFLSRGPGGHDVVYASQRESELQRSHRRANRLLRKLQGGRFQGSHQSLPPKPARMRQTTYTQLIHELRQTERRIDKLFQAGAEQIVARLERRSRQTRQQTSRSR